MSDQENNYQLYVYALMHYDHSQTGTDGQTLETIHTTETGALNALEVRVADLDFELEENDGDDSIIKGYTDGETGFYIQRVPLTGMDQTQIRV